MVNVIVKIMFSVVIIDLTIGFLWVGIIGFVELRETFNKAFPNADFSQFKAVWERLTKKVGNDTETNN